MIYKFWWSYIGDYKKIHWVKWERLCEAKEDGGMGFKEIEKFNEALLAKQVWCMMNNSDSLCYKFLKDRFFPNCSILEANDLKVGSYAWKSILSAREPVKKGVVWRIGNGDTVSIREDKWLLDPCYRSIISPLPFTPPNSKVSCLINSNSSKWKSNMIQ